MANMTGNMWNSYNLIEDFNVFMNPYEKQSKRPKKQSTQSKINNNHKYHLDEIGIWNIGEYTGESGELAVVQIVNLLTDTYTVIPQYQVKILDGNHKDKILTVFENEAIEQIDPTPYMPDTHLPNDLVNKTTKIFECDINDMKTDISDLRTNINDLINDNIDIKNDILAIKSSGDVDIDSGCTISSFAHELENKVYDIKDLVDHEVSDIKEHIELQEAEIKKVSKVSKLSLLSSINNLIM